MSALIELRLGDWRHVLGDDVGDALISEDPVHEPLAADEFVEHWSPRISGWMACITSHDPILAYMGAYRRMGRLPFAPVPCLSRNPSLRGDGPGRGAVYMMTARPRSRAFASWGSLPCWYHCTAPPDSPQGGVSLDLMRAIVRHYTKPGDLVIDPWAGVGTTLIAAALDGRRALGAEADEATHAEAMRRIEGVPNSPPGQRTLFEAGLRKGESR